MLVKRNCLVGNDRDSDAALGILIGVVIVLFIVIAIISIIVHFVVYAGAAIGGFYSIRNYVLSFKHNVTDSNWAPSPVD